MHAHRQLSRAQLRLLVAGLCALLMANITPGMTFAASSIQYYVNPQGSDNNSGTNSSAPFKSIQKAVDLAQPGDVITLAPGEYFQDVVTKRNGTAKAPITITGPADAVIKGDGDARIFEVHHDYLTFNGFTLDGLAGDPNTRDGYRDKLMYVLGAAPFDGVTGLKVLNMTFRNAGGECLRMRYFVQKSEIANSTFVTCGVHDFRFKAGGKNGEAIYIGTAPEQRGDGKNPNSAPDQSNNNWIHHNTFNTQGNECVDIKEASTNNMVENNVCTGQKDPESAGFDSRGSGNTFRYNTSYGNVGAGFRLGGDAATDGTGNNIYGNTIRDNGAGGISIQRTPQRAICGNTLSNNQGGDTAGSYGERYSPASACTSMTLTENTNFVFIPVSRRG